MSTVLLGATALRGRNILRPQNLVAAGVAFPKPQSYVGVDPMLFHSYVGSHIGIEAIGEESAMVR